MPDSATTSSLGFGPATVKSTRTPHNFRNEVRILSGLSKESKWRKKRHRLETRVVCFLGGRRVGWLSLNVLAGLGITRLSGSISGTPGSEARIYCLILLVIRMLLIIIVQEMYFGSLWCAPNAVGNTR